MNEKCFKKVVRAAFDIHNVAVILVRGAQQEKSKHLLVILVTHPKEWDGAQIYRVGVAPLVSCEATGKSSLQTCKILTSSHSKEWSGAQVYTASLSPSVSCDVSQQEQHTNM